MTDEKINGIKMHVDCAIERLNMLHTEVLDYTDYSLLMDAAMGAGSLIDEIARLKAEHEAVEAWNRRTQPKREAWVSVEEMLPGKPEYDWVLVQVWLVPEGYFGVPHIAELRRGVWYSDCYDIPLEEGAGVKVTHWMPLPAPPAKPETEEK